MKLMTRYFSQLNSFFDTPRSILDQRQFFAIVKLIRTTEQESTDHAEYIERAGKIYEAIASRLSNEIRVKPEIKLEVDFFLEEQKKFQQDERGTIEQRKNTIVQCLIKGNNVLLLEHVRKLFLKKAIRIFEGIPKENLTDGDEKLASNVILGQIFIFNGFEIKYSDIQANYNWFKVQYPKSLYLPAIDKAIVELSDAPVVTSLLSPTP